MSGSLGPSNEGTAWRDAKNLYGFGALDIDGKPVLLDKYKCAPARDSFLHNSPPVFPQLILT